MQVILYNKDIFIMKFLKLGHFPNLEIQTRKVAVYVYSFICWLYDVCEGKLASPRELEHSIANDFVYWYRKEIKKQTMSFCALV
jgi:hypothetical protein